MLSSEPVHKKLVAEIVGAEKAGHLFEIITCIQVGGGSHLCIGRNLPLVEMNKVLPQLLRRYDLWLIHPGRPLKHNTTFFVVQKGLEVFVQRRQ